MNFLPSALVDPGPADSSAAFGARAAAGAQPGDRGAAREGANLGEVTFPDVDDFDVRYVHGYGKVANVEARMVFLELVWDPRLEDLAANFGAAKNVILVKNEYEIQIRHAKNTRIFHVLCWKHPRWSPMPTRSVLLYFRGPVLCFMDFTWFLRA